MYTSWNQSLYILYPFGECHCWWTRKSPRTHVVKRNKTRYESVIWQKPVYQQKIRQTIDNTKSHQIFEIKSDMNWCIPLSRSHLLYFNHSAECHCWCTREFPRTHVAKLYGQLRLISSVLRASTFSVFKIDWKCNFVVLLHHQVWLQLVSVPFWHHLSTF